MASQEDIDFLMDRIDKLTSEIESVSGKKKRNKLPGLCVNAISKKDQIIHRQGT